MSESVDGTLDVGGGLPSALRHGLGAVGIWFGAFVAGIAGILLVTAAVGALGVESTPAVTILNSRAVQVGFAAFAVAYLARRSDRDRFVRARIPTARDLAWIPAIVLALVGASVVFSPVLAAAGLSPPETGTGLGVSLAARPSLWLVVFVGFYLFAAPAEEVVYRGIVQGRLRSAFDTAGVVIGSAVLFGLLHVTIGLLSSGVSPAGAVHWGVTSGIGGLVWGYAYERTENLVVTSVAHAMVWTMAFLPVESVLPTL